MAFQAEAARAVAAEDWKTAAFFPLSRLLPFFGVSSNFMCKPGLGKPAISLAMPPQPAGAWLRP